LRGVEKRGYAREARKDRNTLQHTAIHTAIHTATHTGLKREAWRERQNRLRMNAVRDVSKHVFTYIHLPIDVHIYICTYIYKMYMYERGQIG